MRHIDQDEAVRAVELLLAVANRALCTGAVEFDLDAKIDAFLFDADGDLRFEERPDASPLCPCNTCGPAGPFTCVRED